MSTTETVKNIAADGEVRIAMGGPARYWIAGTFGGGTITVRSYSPSQSQAIALTTPAPFTADTVFESNDPFLEFSMAGSTTPVVVVTAMPIITRDRGI